jgi:hypothetical protein
MLNDNTFSYSIIISGIYIWISYAVPQPVQIPLKKSRYKNKRMPKMMSETACNENCICAKVTEAQGKEILEIINRSK